MGVENGGRMGAKEKLGFALAQGLTGQAAKQWPVSAYGTCTGLPLCEIAMVSNLLAGGATVGGHEAVRCKRTVSAHNNCKVQRWQNQ
jgi:hypothetical protein